MGLETARSIAEMNETYPLGSDQVKFGDDHLRLVKRLLKTDLSWLWSYNRKYSFQAGATVTATDCLFNEANNKFYLWKGTYLSGNYIVPAGSTPETAGGIGDDKWVDVGTATLKEAFADKTGAALVGYIDGRTVEQVLTALISSLSLAETFTSTQYYAKLIQDGGNPSISFYGDSTMWGATVGNLGVQDPNNPPAAWALGYNLLTGRSATVNNRAISGTTLRQMLAGTDGSGSTFLSKISTGGVDQNTQIIVCNHGINDSQLNGDINQYRADLISFIQLVRQKGKCPVLATPNPNPQLLIIDEIKSKRLPKYVTIMREVAAAQSCTLVDQYYFFDKSFGVFTPEEVIPDGAHLSTLAYKQAGMNLLIPFFSAHTLRRPGEIAGLEGTSYFDNCTVSRQIQFQGNRAGGVFTANRGSNAQGMNFPVILDSAQTRFQYHGLEWGSAAKVFPTIFGASFGNVWFPSKSHGSIVQIDWDSGRVASGRFFAGFNIMGWLFDQTFTDPVRNGFAFAGISLVKFPAIQDPNTTNTTDQVWIESGVTASAFMYLVDGSSYNFVDSKGGVVMTLSKTGGVLTLTISSNGSVVGTTSSIAGITNFTYPVRIRPTDAAINVDIAQITLSIAVAQPLPRMKAPIGGSAWTIAF